VLWWTKRAGVLEAELLTSNHVTKCHQGADLNWCKTQPFALMITDINFHSNCQPRCCEGCCCCRWCSHCTL